MHRRHLIDLLQRHAATGPEQLLQARPFVAFVREHQDCLLRSCAPGHVTASAWILSPEGDRCLLTLHRKLQRWLQLGGHVDGDERVERAALREAREESGMQHFDLLSPDGVLRPLDLDVHPIPARGGEAQHLHWDVRFLLQARPGQRLAASEESNALRWIQRTSVWALTEEDSVLRLDRLAARWLAEGVHRVPLDVVGGSSQ